jgi:hypothetical protein
MRQEAVSKVALSPFSVKSNKVSFHFYDEDGGPDSFGR